MPDSFYAVDSDLRPVRLYPVTRAVGESTRWYVFPKGES